ncbi:MAG: hypothetical protein QOG58_392, partial [Caballeronia sp.]|nr:hypothetical protein [Caballeronia sp.]
MSRDFHLATEGSMEPPSELVYVVD